MLSQVKLWCCSCAEFLAAIRYRNPLYASWTTHIALFWSAVIFSCVIYAVLCVETGTCLTQEESETPHFESIYYQGERRVYFRNNDTNTCYLTWRRGERRLGNMMFVYASFLGIAFKINCTPILEFDTKLSQFFDTRILSSTVDNSTFKRISFVNRGEPGAIKFDSNLFYQKPKTNIALEGYYQSYYYFDYMKDTIRKEFTFKQYHQSKVHSFFKTETQHLNFTLWDNVLKIGIHVRRGDMLEKGMQNFGFVVAGIDYYEKAMVVIRQRYGKDGTLLWVIAGNGLSWAKVNIRPSAGEYAIYSDADPATDMAVLASCDHVIVSSGSFGWWAGFLAGGDVIYFKNWIKNGTELDRISNTTTYFYPHWTAVI